MQSNQANRKLKAKSKKITPQTNSIRARGAGQPLALIGWPSAGAAMPSHVVGACGLPSIVFASGGQGAGGLGDITGKFKGGAAQRGVSGSMTATLFKVKRGKRGGVKRTAVSKRRGLLKASGRVARSVGSSLYGAPDCAFAVNISIDSPLFEDRREFLLWAMGFDGDLPDQAFSNPLQRTIQQPDVGYSYNLGERLQSLALRAARKQARRLHQLRGVEASETSIEDAASDAVLSVLNHVRRLDKTSAAHWDNGRFLRVLYLFASRGAFNSLASWSSAGISGETSVKSRTWVSELTLDLAAKLGAEQLASGAPLAVSRHLNPDEQPTDSDQRARRQAVRWVYSIGFRQFAAGLPVGSKGNSAALRAARQRCRVIGAVIFGASMADAALHAGFSSVQTFLQSAKGSGLFIALQAARDTADCGAVETARIAQRSYALRAAAAIKQLRAIGPVLVNGREVNTGTLRQAGARGRDAVRNVLAWRQLMAERVHCLTLAKHYKSVVKSNIAANRDSFGQVLRNLQSHLGDFRQLRQTLGLADTKGRAFGAAKRDSVTIRAAKGSVQHKRADNLTVSLAVGRSARNLPCARLAPAMA